MTDTLSTDIQAPGQSKGEQRLLFIACFVALVATAFAFMIRIMLMDTWQVEFNLSKTEMGEIGGAGFWPFGISIVLFSLVIDRIGYGKSMIFAFACHGASAVLMMTANGYWPLYIGSILNGLAAGTVEAVINPAIASIYTRNKTKMLTILHAGWPGGMALAGVVMQGMKAGEVGWRWQAGIILVPTVIYGLMLLKSRFPVSERVLAKIPYKDMLREAGAIGALIVMVFIMAELRRVFKLNTWLSGAIVLAVVLAYLAYTRSLGRGMYIFLLVVMILLAITELSTDNWIKDIMKERMGRLKWDSGWLIVYTATIMMILRFCIGPIVKLLKPLGVLLVSSLFAAAGLFFLARMETIPLIWVMATIYGVGQTFFWPVTLGVISERFPKGGALTLNAIAGVGMLAVGILGNPLFGNLQDNGIDGNLLAADKDLHAEVIDPQPRTSVITPFTGQKYKALDQTKTGPYYDIVAIYERQAEVMGKAKVDSRPTSPDADVKYVYLVNNAFDSAKPPKPKEPPKDADATVKGTYGEAKALWEADMEAYKEAAKTHAGRVAYLSSEIVERRFGSKIVVTTKAGYDKAKKKTTTIDGATIKAKQDAMAIIAILPVIMALCYLGLILYFRSKGGYRVVELSSAGGASEREPTVAEEVADQADTPTE